MSEGQKGNATPKQVVVDMLSKTYDDLDDKNMSKDQFISGCLDVIRDKKKRKSSPLILPGD